MRPFVIHAHFYQPERTNPWTGTLDPEPSAAPFRDWNERVHDDCYRPNGAARIYDEQGRVERIVNNYERVSFDFGPTLLRWLEGKRPQTYAKVVDGDWRTMARTGHGNALAQAYHHVILPLASARDRRTQIRWGLADFRHRFGRQAEGMWLPETAADQATIDALIDANVRFTVLAPHQARRVRHRDGDWHDAGDRLDTGRAYRVAHSDGSGRSIATFFYDGALAQWLAFDHAAGDAGELVRRLADAEPSGGLVHAAVDGETFGHHRRFGELGLAYALFEAAGRAGLEPTSYAAWLAEHPAVDDAELADGEGTSWSCVHGVGRWYRDCGCATDSAPGWDQQWRTPLRKALDVVRDAAAEVFEERGAALFKEAWSARDDYVRLLLGEVSRQGFLDRHALRNIGDSSHVDLWTLLESQRHAMVMYTSCGWFFADVSGIETVYVLRSAARVLDLLGELGAGAGVREQVLGILAEARSNKPGVGSGADVWRHEVEPSEVTPARVASHLCLIALTHPERRDRYAAGGVLDSGGLQVSVRDLRTDRRARQAMVTARIATTSNATGRSEGLAVVALHLGGVDFYGLVVADPGPQEYARLTEPLWAAFPTAPIARLLQLAAAAFGDAAVEFDVDGAMPGGKQEIVGAVFGELTERFGEQYARLYHDHRRILEMMVDAGYELPRDLRAAAELTLTSQLEAQLVAARDAFHGEEPPEAAAFATIRETLAMARSHGCQLDLTAVASVLGEAVAAASGRAARTLQPADVDLVAEWIDVSREVGVDIDLSRPQEAAWGVAVQARAGRLRADQAEAVADLGALLGLSPAAWTRTP
jgi:hypothetical protein